MTDEEILNCDIEEFEKKTKGDDSQITPEIGEEDESEDDDDDDFECDIERYVPFDDKLDFADKLKTCGRECLTEIMKIVIEL
jgi:hypothetical protein